MSSNPKTQATRARWARRERVLARRARLLSGVGTFICSHDCTHGVDLMAYCAECEAPNASSSSTTTGQE